MDLKTRSYIGVTAAVGLAIAGWSLLHWSSSDPVRFVCYVLLAVLASRMRVELPGINGTMSVTFLFILIGVLELTLPETIVIGCAATLVQCFWRVRNRPKLIQVVFNVFSMMATAIGATFWTYRHSMQLFHGKTSLMLVSAAFVYFLFNTIPVAIVISMTEHKPVRAIWAECYFWSLPYYLVGAGIAGSVNFVNQRIGWHTSLLVLPVVYWIYRSYRLYLGRLEDEKRHVEEMAALHLRTIEALALAIEAKDHTTHDHLQRVRVYAVEIGKELGLTEHEIEALRAAALLHDIGKLAVPEHIINKPGRLSPEEFEKMKIHPLVGAEILERVSFPYPVVPIVLAHHEKWDGSGYPFGLKGEQIPIGARILSAVDCLDALASHRQYRRALPLDDAMREVIRLAGKEFDPAVVDVLKRRYVELERMALSQSPARPLKTDMVIERGEAPAAGFERANAGMQDPNDSGFLTAIAAARQEAHTLFELSHELGSSLSLGETLSLLGVRLQKLVPYDSIAVYIVRDRQLVPEFVSGDNFRLFGSTDIPLGEGLSGWVARHCRPILNGNPSVEPSCLKDPGQSGTLRSALSVPLKGMDGVVGVLSLYKSELDAFTRDHLRILLAISSKVGLAMENALKYQQAETSATTDYLTGLPNARSLFLHLDGEIARCKRSRTSLALMVCDLDGFKQVNDRFGHLEGNKVLRLFAQALKACCREYDYVARMGGDEFVMVMPGMRRESTQEKIAQITNLANEIGRQVCGDSFLSVSIGSTFFGDDGTDAEQLLSEADRRMYIVKQSHHEPDKYVKVAPLTGVSTTIN